MISEDAPVRHGGGRARGRPHWFLVGHLP